MVENENYQQAKFLNYYGCSMQKIIFQAPLESLATLILSFNRLSDLKFLENCQNLETLDISYNQISIIKYVGQLKKLTVLHV